MRLTQKIVPIWCFCRFKKRVIWKHFSSYWIEEDDWILAQAFKYQNFVGFFVIIGSPWYFVVAVSVLAEMARIILFFENNITLYVFRLDHFDQPIAVKVEHQLLWFAMAKYLFSIWVYMSNLQLILIFNPSYHSDCLPFVLSSNRNEPSNTQSDWQIVKDWETCI